MRASARRSTSRARGCRTGRSRSRWARRSTTAGAATSAAGRARAGDAGRRARGAGRHAGHDGAPQPAGAGARRQRAGRPRRVHGLPAQPDRQGALVAQPEHPQRVPDDGAACRQRAVEPGARADALLVDVSRRDAEGTAESHLPRRLVRLSHQPGDLVLGHACHRRQDRALSVRRRVRLHARRDQPLRRHPAARRDRPREPAADPHRRLEVRRAVLEPPGLRAAPAGSRDTGRGARLHRRSRPNWRNARASSTSTTRRSTAAPPACR